MHAGVAGGHNHLLVHGPACVRGADQRASAARRVAAQAGGAAGRARTLVLRQPRGAQQLRAHGRHQRRAAAGVLACLSAATTNRKVASARCAAARSTSPHACASAPRAAMQQRTRCGAPGAKSCAWRRRCTPPVRRRAAPARRPRARARRTAARPWCGLGGASGSRRAPPETANERRNGARADDVTVRRRVTRRRPSGRRMASLGEDLSASTKIGYSFLCVALVLFAGLMSGLTLGLLSLDRVELEVRARLRVRAAAARSLGPHARAPALSGASAAERRCWCAAARRSRSDKRPQSYRCGCARARGRRGRDAGGAARRHVGIWFDACFRCSSSKRGTSC